MSDTLDQPPDENEAYESLDEALDDDDAHGRGPEGGRDLDTDVIVDRAELEEAGADLDDPERMALLDGGMDDPDGTGPPVYPAGVDTAGWDVDPVDDEGGFEDDVGADGDAVGAAALWDLPDGADDPELEFIVTDATAMDDVPDDAPGADSARW